MYQHRVLRLLYDTYNGDAVATRASVSHEQDVASLVDGYELM